MDLIIAAVLKYMTTKKKVEMIRKITGVLLAVTLLTVPVIPSVQPANAQSVPTFLFKFGSFFTGDGQFIFTFGVTTNNADDIIVVDFGNHRVQVFDASGNFLFKFGSFGFGNGQFRNPTGVAVNSLDNIIVVDSPNHRVQVFDSSGNFLYKFGSFGGGNGFFIGPQGVAVNSSDDIIVVDRNNSRIQVFDSTGNFKFKFGSPGSGDGQFDFPFGVAVDGLDNIIVVDRNNNRVQKFDSSGNFLFKFGSLGSGDAQFDGPFGVAADNSDNIIVVDTNNHRVQVFDSSGNFLFKFASFGSGDGQFNKPHYAAVNSSGNIIVTDTNNHRVQVFGTPIPPLPHPFLFLADKKIKIDGLLSSDGDMHSNDKIDFHKGNPSLHTGNLTAVGKVKIDKDHTIAGDVTAGGKIDLKGNAVVTGTVNENTSVAVEALPVLSFSAGGDKVTVKKNQSQSLAPGSYGKVKVEKGGTLELSSGNYFFKELDLKDNTTLSIDVSAGPVTVNTVKKLHFHKNSEVDINSPIGSASRFVTFNSMKKVDIHKGAKVLGSIIAPNDKVHLHKNVSFRGAICAKDIDVDKGGILLHHNSSGILPKIIAPILVVDIDEDVEEEELASAPTEFELSQNYPNPFNPSTTIQFSIPEDSEVTLSIYNINGQLVRTLFSGTIKAGRHSAVWNGKDFRGAPVASGIYLYQLKVGGYTQVKKMSLLR